ncbi:hypothetical protein HWV62_18522 [Athelia sp. TMB]|nr:hypothetical protein HWV62_18522 [Athelia sp. TMB]
MATASSSSSTFLYYPSDDPADEADEVIDPKAEKLKNKPLSKDRLYVGNLHPTVDEYTLLTIFSKYGTVKSMDYLFHKTGPSRGKPRGFAFIEFADQSSALSALSALHDKLLRGRKLVVTFAHQAPPLTSHTPGGRKRGADASKPTTLSLMKSGRGDGPNSKDKIALLEAKLLQMGSSSSLFPPVIATAKSPASTPNEAAPTFPTGMDAPTPAPSSAPPQTPAPAHPSLPPKPAPPPITSFHLPRHNATSSDFNSNGKRQHPRKELPTLSQLQHTRLASTTGQSVGFAASLAGSYAPSPSPSLGTPKEPIRPPDQMNTIPSVASTVVSGAMTPGAMASHAKSSAPASTASRPKTLMRGSLAGVKIVKSRKQKEEGIGPD